MYTKFEQTALFSRYIPLKTAILERGHGIIMTQRNLVAVLEVPH